MVTHDAMDTSASDIAEISDVSTASFNTSLDECGEMSLASSGVLARQVHLI